MKKRVVVTGIGMVTPLGNDVETTWKGIVEGRSGIGPLTRKNPDLFPVKIAAEVKDFDVTKYVDAKDARRMDRFVQYAIASAIQAANDADLQIGENVIPNRVGTWIGSGIGGLETLEDQVRVFDQKGTKRVSPFFIPMMIPDMASGQVSIALGAKGPNGCTVTACASGANSIGESFKIIQRGDADVMITGGTEAPITDVGLAGFSSLKALSFNENPSEACRPFDASRDGFIISEGAGVLILEELEHALSRGAKIYAEIVGYGASGDAYHITAPDPSADGSVRSIEEALRDGNITPEKVDYINAHGTSTEYNDKNETAAIKRVFGDHAYKLAVSSTKSMTGHPLGAAGAIEAIFSILSIKDSVLPPTINYMNPDPECDLDYVPNVARKSNVSIVLSNSLGFGGHNATLAFRKFI